MSEFNVFCVVDFPFCVLYPYNYGLKLEIFEIMAIIQDITVG